MFISASNIVKFHQCTGNREDNDLEYARKTSSKIIDLAVCNDNTYVALLPENENPQIISMREKSHIHLVHTITAVKDVRCLTFKNLTKRYLALGTRCGDIFIYDTKERVPVKRFPNLQKQIEILKFTDSDNELIAACGASVYILQKTSEENTNSFKMNSKCTALAHQDGEQNILAAGSESGNIKLWDINSSSKLFDLQLHMSQVSGLQLSQCKNLLITAGIDHKICLINIESGSTEFIVSLHNAVTSIDLSIDELYLAVGLEDGAIYLYDTRQMIHPLQILQSHDSAVNKICFDNEECTNFEFSEDNSEISTPSLFTSRIRATGGDTTFIENKKNYQLFNDKKCEKLQGEGLGVLKKDLERYASNEFEDLYSQFTELSGSFQKFLDNEMKGIQDVVQTKREALTEDRSIYHSPPELL